MVKSPTGKPAVLSAMPGYEHLRAMPPGSCKAVINSEKATALVSFLPYSDSPFNVSYRSSGEIEILFATLADARDFYTLTCSSNQIERAKLYERAPGYLLGRKLVDEWNEPVDSAD